MRNLYIANNKKEKFKVLVAAEKRSDALNILKGYAKDAKLVDNWKVSPTFVDRLDSISFDCDYLIQKETYDLEHGDVIYIDDVQKYLFSLPWTQKTFIATEVVDFHARCLIMNIEVADGVDFEKAVMEASSNYCLTEEGKKIYEHNCNNFNWGDFNIYVPNSICEQYGIRKINSNVSEEFDFNQSLVI